MEEKQTFTVEAKEGYIHLETKGKLDYDHLDAPANAALSLAKEKNIDVLLDDIRGIDSTGVSITMQSKAMGILWKLRSFRKVAIVLKAGRVQNLFFSTLNVLHLNGESHFKGFNTVEEAVVWLREP